MRLLSRHWPRIAGTLLPLVFVLMHASGILRIGVLQRLDDIIYDARLRGSMPATMDERIVIVDFDEKSLAEFGWPWGRNKHAALMGELFERQKVALAGLDLVFAEGDESSGLKRLKQLAQTELKDQPGFSEKLNQLQASLDYDAVFAKALENRPVVMGYYFTSDRDGRVNGVLPEPVMARDALRGRPIQFTRWNGYGANLEPLAKAAPMGGFFNALTDRDGVVRSLPPAGGIQGAVLRIAGTGHVSHARGPAQRGARLSAGKIPERQLPGPGKHCAQTGQQNPGDSGGRPRGHLGAISRQGWGSWRLVPVCLGRRCAGPTRGTRPAQGQDRADRHHRARPA